MTYLSGSTLYNYTLAMEYARTGYDVTVLSNYNQFPIMDAGRNVIVKNMMDAKIKLVNFTTKPIEDVYDVVFASQPTTERWVFKMKNLINIVHSEYDCETPMMSARRWVAIRPQIKEHLIQSHKIADKDIFVIYNGVDRVKFSPSKRVKNSSPFQRIVVPCTLDYLRKKFIDHCFNVATPTFTIDFYGMNVSRLLLKESKYVTIHPPRFDIEEAMKDADAVWGILLGRVNLEANSMGIKSVIFDPVTLKSEDFFLPEDVFDARHNIVNVAKQLLEIAV